MGKWLSDWHLVSFLCYQGLFSLVCLTTPCQQKLICRRNRRSYVEPQQLTLMRKTIQPWRNCSTVTAGEHSSRSQNLQVSPLCLLQSWLLMIQGADLMKMVKEIILHSRHSMISVSIRLVVEVGVGVMLDREFVLIVLLSTRVLGRIVISVDYRLVGSQEKSQRQKRV